MGELGLALEGSPRKHVPDTVADLKQRARALVCDHFDFVWRLLRRLGVPTSDLDDVAQQVFIVGTQRLPDIPHGSERTFLYGTALRMAATLRRNARRKARFIERVPALNDESNWTPHDELERQQALDFLDRVLNGLGDEEREVFVLCQIEELSAPVVASLLGIPPGTVASRLRRARQAFAEQLKRLKARGM